MSGFIPGPGEDEQQFRERVNYCSTLKETIPSAEGPFLEEASQITAPLYNIAPAWVPITFSNDKLAPWHGGCAWIFQMEEGAPIGAYLQLRTGFKHRERYAGLYDRKELIAHELCHVGRMAYDEPKFEEFFAYRMAKGWRRWLGPIVQSSGESMIFVLSLVLVLFADLFAIFVDPTAINFSLWLKLLPAGLIILALVRLWIRHRQLERCIDTLSKIVGGKAEAVAYRLTDAEVIGCRSVEAFREYAKAQDSLRWRTIVKSYFG